MTLGTIGVAHRAPTFRSRPYSARGAALVGQAMFAVLDRARALEAAGAVVRHLELGDPADAPPPVVIAETIAALERGELHYTSPAGLPDLRAALGARLRRVTGRPVGVDEVVVSPANLLINQVLDLVCDPGDRLVLFTPAFPTYLAAAWHAKLEVVEHQLAPERGFTLSEDDVDAALARRPRAIIVNSANNPTGAVYDAGVLTRLARGCAAAGVWLLSDETYADLVFAQSFASLAPRTDERLVVISSLSKVLAIPGFRIGWALARPPVAERLALSTSTLLSCLPTFVQRGAVAGLEVLDAHAALMRARAGRATAAATARLRSAPALGWTAPAAAFYAFVDVSRTGLDGLAFATRLLEEHHTAVTPGAAFGADFDDWIRLALCGPRESVAAGIDAVVALATEHPRGHA